MGAVMIKCPQTGRDIATGMVADRERFRTMPVFFGQTLLSALPHRARMVRAGSVGVRSRAAAAAERGSVMHMRARTQCQRKLARS